MATPDDAELREAARARGFRLVKSRRRKPGGDFGRYGLAELKGGRECFGFGAEGLTATAEEVRAYLRGGEVASWKRSLIGVVGESGGAKSSPAHAPKVEKGGGTPLPVRPERSRRAPARTSERKRDSPPKSPHSRESGSPASPSPPSEAGEDKRRKRDSRFRGNDEAGARPQPLFIREATRRDAATLAKLLDLPAAPVAKRLAAAIKAGEPPLVAEQDGPVACLGWTIAPSLSHGPTGRITLLFVEQASRRQGLGTRLLAEAERRLAAAGVDTVALDIEIDFDAPAAFLRKTGFTRTANGYGKSVRGT